MNFDIMEVFTRAWKITWKHKVLWLFGMLASCGRGSNSNSSGNNQRSTSNGQFPTEGPFSDEMMQQMVSFFEGVGAWFSDHSWVIIALIVLFIIFLLLQIFLSVTGGIGLIRGAYQAETGVETIHFGSLFGESLRYFWRVIGLGLVIYLPVLLPLIGMLVVFILSIDKVSAAPAAGMTLVLFFVGLCCCFLPLMIVLGFYYSQAQRALILEDLGVFKSLSRGWEVFRNNIGGLLLVGLMIFIITLIISLMITIPVYIAIFPLLFKILDGSITSWNPFILTGAFLLCYSPIAWFLNGIVLTYTETVWTVIYMRVTKPREETPVLLPQVDA